MEYKKTHMTDSYLRNIQQMNDKKLLFVLKKRDNYTDEFLQLAAEEATKRGYDCRNIQFENIDKLVFRHKPTNELVKIVSDKSKFYERSDMALAIAEIEVRDDELIDLDERYEIALAIAELEVRNYDLSSLIIEIENKRKNRRRGNVSGSMFSFQGIGTKLYGNANKMTEHTLQHNGLYFFLFL